MPENVTYEEYGNGLSGFYQVSNLKKRGFIVLFSPMLPISHYLV